MSKELENKLAQAVALVESVKKEIAESKELKPYDWKTGKSLWGINHEGIVGPRMLGSTASLFNFDEEEVGKRFTHKLKILSCINNLKKSLGCNWEFTHTQSNYFVRFNERSMMWGEDCYRYLNEHLVYFKTRADAQKVAKYLNKHYPYGWSLA